MPVNKSIFHISTGKFLFLYLLFELLLKLGGGETINAQTFENYVQFPDCQSVKAMSFDPEQILANENPFKFYKTPVDSLESLYCFAKKSNNLELEASSLLYLAHKYPSWFLDEMAFYKQVGYLEESARICKENGFYKIHIWTKTLLSSLFVSNKLYNQAEKNAIEHLDIALQIKDTFSIAEGYMMLGRILREKKQYIKADSILQLSLSYQTGNYVNSVKAFTYLHLSNLRRLEARYKASIQYSEQGMKYAENAATEKISLQGYLATEKILSLIKIKEFEEVETQMLFLEKSAARGKNLEANYHFINGQILEARKSKKEEIIGAYLKAFHKANEIGSNLLVLEISEKLMPLFGDTYELSNRADEVHKIASVAYNELTQKNNLDNLFRVSYSKIENERNNYQLRLKNSNRILFFLFGIFLLFVLIGILLLNIYKKTKLLAKQNQELVDKEKSFRILRNNLFANLSHEFRTPLTVIKTAISEIQENKVNEPQKGYTQMINYNIDNLTNLTNQMLDLAKMSEGKLIVKPVLVEVTEYIELILSQVVLLSENKQIQLFLIAPEKPLSLQLDKNIIQKIVLNLISNAIKFTPKNGKIDILLEYNSDSWSIKVTDTGIGLTENQIPYIFDRYFRPILEENQSNTGGLGLALTKQLVELCNGTITVQSKEGIGSTFYVTFPYEQRELEPTLYQEKQAKLIEVATKSFIPKVKNIRQQHIGQIINRKDEKIPSILIIEDNVDLNFLLYELLRQQYNVNRAFDGKQALKCLEEETPDLILADIMMPNMNGFQFIENIRANINFSHIPILIISALESSIKDMKLWKDGIVDFISKPFDSNVLKYKVTNQLASRQEFRTKLLEGIQENGASSLLGPEIASVDKELLEKFMRYLSDNLADENLSSNVISKAMGMSRSSLNNKINALTGIPPMTFLRKYRLKRAKELLIYKAGNVTEIGMQVGFYNSSFFSRIFKEEYGVPPKSYLKN